MKSRLFALAILLATGGCSSKNEDQLIASNAVETVNQQDTTVAKPTPPAPRYDFKEGLTYGYISGVSEEDRKKGKAAGDVLTFTYHGNEGGVYRLRLVDAKGDELARYECAKPCVAIKAFRPGGLIDRIAFSPESMIGSAYQDALNGLLEPVPVVKTAVLGPSGWAGTYDGAFEGDARGSVEIKDRGKLLAVEIGVGSERCAGGIEFTTPRPTGSTLVKRMPIDESGLQCTITMIRKGREISVDEEDCFYHHGAECSFNGAASR